MSLPECATVPSRPSPLTGTIPEVQVTPEGDYLVLANGVDYLIPADPARVLGLLYHLSEKSWMDRQFLRHAIGRIAAARGWTLHF